MNVDRMRMIDHRVGVPFCFLTTFLVKLFGRTAPAGTTEPAPRSATERGS